MPFTSAWITVKSVTIKLCMGFIIRRIHWDLRYFICFLALRDNGFRYGKVHGRVQWVDQPDFGHLFDIGWVFPMHLPYTVYFWLVCSTIGGHLGPRDRERIFLSSVRWWILNGKWLSDGFFTLHKFRMLLKVKSLCADVYYSITLVCSQ